MSFQKTSLSPVFYCIIDIGSYKLRACGIEIQNGKIKILSYKEKRQESSYLQGGECHDIQGLSQSIFEIIQSLEQESEKKFDDIVFSYPFNEVFMIGKELNLIRNNAEVSLSSKELETLLEKAENICLKELEHQSSKLFGLSSENMSMILSRVQHFHIDGKKNIHISGSTGKEIHLSLLNIFIPKNKYSILHHIGIFLQKNVSQILPIEYSLSKIFPENDMVCVNIGATQTGISLKKNGEIIALSKMAIGMNDLIGKVAKNTSKTRLEIIEELSDSGKYLIEKKEFLDIWSESFLLSLENMLEGTVCPQNLYIGGAGGNSKFIEDFIRLLPYQKNEVKMLPQFHFIEEDMSILLEKFKDIKLEYIKKVPLDMYVMMIELGKTISQEGEIVSSSLKKVVEKLGYLHVG